MTLVAVADGCFDAPPALHDWAQHRQWHDFVDASGEAWRYRDSGARGTATPLVLLPGALGNADTAWRLDEAFRAERRVIAITYPGHASARALADGLDALLRSLGTGPVALWGSSYGAAWAQAFAAAHPDRVTALWLGNTFVDGDDVAGLPLFDAAWLDAASPDEVVARWHAGLMARPDDLLRGVQLHMLHRGLPASAFRARLRQVARAAALPAATAIANTVVCACADDAVITASVRSRVQARYPAARHLLLPHGGHYPHIVTPEALVPAMRAWLA